MESPFDALHAGIESQILNLPAGIPDSQAIRQAKSLPDSVEKFRALGKALSRQLRYREAVAAYTEGLNLEPENLSLLRLRAGRYLTTLQSDPAIADFEKCLTLGAEKLDCLYRIGLAQYYAGRYEQAMEAFEGCMPLCDDEMGIAVLYWHTLSAVRTEKAPTLLKYYRPDMAVGFILLTKRPCGSGAVQRRLQRRWKCWRGKKTIWNMALPCTACSGIQTAPKESAFPKCFFAGTVSGPALRTSLHGRIGQEPSKRLS